MKNISYFAVFLGLILITGTVPVQSFADVISPKQQMKLGFTLDQIICSEDMVKIVKSSSGEAACVKPSTAEKLSENGWANPLSVKTIEEIENEKIEEEESLVSV